MELPVASLTERLSGDAGRRQLGEPAVGAAVAGPARATRDEAIAYLGVLSHPVTRRVLFAVNGRWSAMVDNHRDGSDFGDDHGVVGDLCGARTCRVVDSPDLTCTVRGFAVRQSSPARIFELRDRAGRTTRSVACVLDGDRWVFETAGTPLVAEADFPYTARRKRDRFGSEHLHRLVASIGAGPRIVDAFNAAERFVLLSSSVSGRPVEVCTPEEADDPAYAYFRRGLGWVPHMETHAESVVWDMTRAILLNPARERDARPPARCPEAPWPEGVRAHLRGSRAADAPLRSVTAPVDRPPRRLVGDDPPMSDELAAASLAVLRERGVSLADGLTAEELAGIERRLGFAFGPDHAALLGLAVPVGDAWVDWRGPEEELRERLAWPVDGLLFDVEHNGFWAGSWGPRPGAAAEAVEEARRHLLRWPKLVPLFAHRYLPAAPAPSGSPVFSIYQADVVYYGADLHDYVLRELGGRGGAVGDVAHPVEPWSSLAMGLEDRDL